MIITKQAREGGERLVQRRQPKGGPRPARHADLYLVLPAKHIVQTDAHFMQQLGQVIIKAQESMQACLNRHAIRIP